MPRDPREERAVQVVGVDDAGTLRVDLVCALTLPPVGDEHTREPIVWMPNGA